MQNYIDSLIYHVKCDDVYDIMKRDISRFDMSDHTSNNAQGISFADKKVPDLMEDENNGAIMIEFIGLRAKMYALRVEEMKGTERVKSIKKL